MTNLNAGINYNNLKRSHLKKGDCVRFYSLTNIAMNNFSNTKFNCTFIAIVEEPILDIVPNQKSGLKLIQTRQSSDKFLTDLNYQEVKILNQKTPNQLK